MVFFGKEGRITLNVVTIMRRICEEVESVLDYDFTDLNMQLGVMNLTHHMPNVESICSSTVKAILDLEWCIDPCSHRDRTHHSSH